MKTFATGSRELESLTQQKHGSWAQHDFGSKELKSSKHNKLVESDAVIQRTVSCGDRGPRRSPARYEYQNRMKLPLLVTALVFPMIAHAGEISKVKVLDNEFREIKVLSTQSELSAFGELWSAKTAHKPTVVVKWLYKLDISEESRGDRWLYHPVGWVQVLTKGPATMYKISSPGNFNRLIGIHNKPSEPTR